MGLRYSGKDTQVKNTVFLEIRSTLFSVFLDLKRNYQQRWQTVRPCTLSERREAAKATGGGGLGAAVPDPEHERSPRWETDRAEGTRRARRGTGAGNNEDTGPSGSHIPVQRAWESPLSQQDGKGCPAGVLSGLSAGLRTEKSPVPLQVTAHAWVVGSVPSRGACERQPI